MTIGFLHTSPVHVTTFDALLAAEPGVRAVHVVDESLLEDAGRGDDLATGAALADRVAVRLAEVRAGGADVVVCTCSTIAGLAEAVGGPGVVRVDRPAARRAVTAGERVGVVIAVESTLAPTRDLLETEAAQAGVVPMFDVVLAPGAWEAWEAGDAQSYLGLIATCARDLAARHDVVLLAQASMAGALDLLPDLTVPVIATPPSAVAHAMALAHQSRRMGR